MKFNVLIYPENIVPIAFRAQANSILAQAWPEHNDFSHDPLLKPISMLLEANNKIYATLDILSKDFRHQNENYSASGLSCVATAPNERGKGYGKMLVTAAYQLIRQNNSDIGLFTCDTYLEKFYTTCGWDILENTHLIGGTPKEPFSSEQFDKVTLVSFFSQKAQKNAHTFNDCNIELYSGDIDRLW